MRRFLSLSLTFGALTALIAGCSTGDVAEDDDTTSQEGNLTQVSPADETLPEELMVSDFDFSGFEYWPFAQEQPLYPDKIQWGFEAGSEPGRKCMAASTRAIAEILKDPPASLLKLREEHQISSFFNWNNDYTGAERNGMARMRRLWLYESSLIKWISETNTDGSCLVPTREELDQFATKCLTQFPNCSL
jgi:hypothetical protein